MKLKITILSVFCMFINGVFAQWQQTVLNNKTIVSMTSKGSSIFVGTTSDGIFRSDDEGASWTQINNGLTNYSVFGVWGMGSFGSFVYAGTADGTFISSDNGNTWANTGNLIGVNAVYSFVFQNNDIYVGTGGNVYKSSDNAVTWNYAGNGIPSLSNTVRSLVGNGANLYAGSYNNGGVYVSTDNAATWTSAGLSTYPIRAMGVNGNHLFAATSDTIFYSADNGTTWEARNNGISIFNRWTLCFTFDGNRVFTGKRGAGVYFSDDNGLNWISAGNGLPAGSYVNKLLINGNYIYAGADYQQGVWKRALSEFTGIEEAPLVSSDIYPNPAQENLYVHSKTNSGKYVVTDLAGKEVNVKILRQSDTETSMDVSTLAPGIYFIRTEKSRTAAKFIVQH